MSRQYWQEALWWAVTDGTAVANTTTETIVFPNVTIPANHMADGRFLIIKAYGKLSTTATPTIIFGLRWGGVAGTLLAVTEALTNGSGVANVNWALEAVIVDLTADTALALTATWSAASASNTLTGLVYTGLSPN